MQLTSESVIETLYLIRQLFFYNGMIFAILYVFSDKTHNISQSLDHIRRVLTRTSVAIKAIRGVMKEVRTTITSATEIIEIVDDLGDDEDDI